MATARVGSINPLQLYTAVGTRQDNEHNRIYSIIYTLSLQHQHQRRQRAVLSHVGDGEEDDENKLNYSHDKSTSHYIHTLQKCKENEFLFL